MPSHVLRPAIVAALAALPAASFAAAATSAPDLLLKALARLAGPAAQDCGTVALGGDRAAAIACARKSISGHATYRLAIELAGSDTYTWQGAVLDERGRQWVVFYDADTSGGESPGLGQLLCSEIRFAPDKEDVIDCVPSTGTQ